MSTRETSASGMDRGYARVLEWRTSGSEKVDKFESSPMLGAASRMKYIARVVTGEELTSKRLPETIQRIRDEGTTQYSQAVIKVTEYIEGRIRETFGCDKCLKDLIKDEEKIGLYINEDVEISIHDSRRLRVRVKELWGADPELSKTLPPVESSTSNFTLGKMGAVLASMLSSWR